MSEVEDKNEELESVWTKTSHPWVTPNIKKLINKRDRAYRKMKIKGSEKLTTKFKDLKRTVQREIRRSYWDYQKSVAEEDTSGHSDSSTMSEGGDRKRKKSKGWYRKQAYHNKRAKDDGEHSKAGHRLAPGLRGFIVTCNDRERDAVKETYNILNEYADELYGPEAKLEMDKGSRGDSSGDDDDDIETAIAKEVEGLKAAASKGERRFQNSQSGAKNCIFIKTTLEDPVGLALAIFRDLRDRKVQKSRHALRLLPVVGTCRATVKDINTLAREVLPPFFKADVQLEDVTYTVTFKARNNNGLGRDAVVSTLRQTIEDAFSSSVPSLRFTHNCPQLTVMVEVMCGVACIAVARDFALYKKYNLVEVALDRSADSNKEEKNSVEKSTGNSQHSLDTAAELAESCENVVRKNVGSSEKEEAPEDKPTEKFSEESKVSEESILHESLQREKSVEKTGESTDGEKEAAQHGLSSEKSTVKEEEAAEIASAGGPTGEPAADSKDASVETVQKAPESTA